MIIVEKKYCICVQICWYIACKSEQRWDISRLFVIFFLKVKSSIFFQIVNSAVDLMSYKTKIRNSGSEYFTKTFWIVVDKKLDFSWTQRINMKRWACMGDQHFLIFMLFILKILFWHPQQLKLDVPLHIKCLIPSPPPIPAPLLGHVRIFHQSWSVLQVGDRVDAYVDPDKASPLDVEGQYHEFLGFLIRAD